MDTNIGLTHRYLNQAIDFYMHRLVPATTWTRRNTLTISTAIVLYVVYKINKSFRPPENLAHIPYIGYITFFKSLFTDSARARVEVSVLPKITSKGSNGIFLSPGRGGWDIHVTNPEAVRKVLLKADLFSKDTSGEKHIHTLIYKIMGGPSILNLNGQEWKSQRKVANPAFQRSMPIHLFGNLTISMFKEIEKSNSTKVDITDLVERWTLDAIGKAGFDFDFNALTDRNNYWVNTYHTIMKGVFSPAYAFLPFIETYFLWMFPKRQQVHKDMDHFLDTINTVIEGKRKKLQNGKISNDSLQENEKDLLTLMLESEMNENGAMTNEELKSNILVFFLAGHDTTSSVVASAIYYMSIHQDIQQRAREEVISIMGDEPEDIIPTLEDTKKLDYVNLIIKEVLRTDAPLNSALIRVATEDTELSGTFIPKGARVNVNISGTHLSDKNWSEPFSFNPDRFSDTQRVLGKPMNWVPFGNGIHQCIGMNFSLAEQRVFFCMLLRKYTWTLPEDSIHKDGLKTKGLGLVSPKDLDVIFKKIY